MEQCVLPTSSSLVSKLLIFLLFFFLFVLLYSISLVINFNYKLPFWFNRHTTDCGIFEICHCFEHTNVQCLSVAGLIYVHIRIPVYDGKSTEWYWICDHYDEYLWLNWISFFARQKKNKNNTEWQLVLLHPWWSIQWITWYEFLIHHYKS